MNSANSFFESKTSRFERVKKLETTETTFSKLEFDKFNLFFRSIPNKISYDKVKIKNIGTTCIYFKWQKLARGFNLPDKKSDGIDRFFCHYVILNIKFSLIQNYFRMKKKNLYFLFFLRKMECFLKTGFWLLLLR